MGDSLLYSTRLIIAQCYDSLIVGKHLNKEDNKSPIRLETGVRT